MAVISTLVARMIADLSGWTPNMNKAKMDMDGMWTSAKKLQSVMGGLASKFTLAGMAYGAIKASQRANETLDLAEGLGVSVEGLQGLQYAMVKAGGDSDKLTMGLNQMIRRLYGTTQGTDEVSKTLNKLGITAQSIQADPVNAVMMLSDAMRKAGGSAEFAKIAFDLFGRSNINMLPLLELGSEKIREYADEARRLGMVLSSKDLMQAEKLSIRTAQAGNFFSKGFQRALSSASSIGEGFWRFFTNTEYMKDGLYGLIEAWADMATAEDEALDARQKEALARLQGQIDKEKEAQLLKDYTAIIQKLETPQETFNRNLEHMRDVFALSKRPIEEYLQSVGRLYDEFERAETEKERNWAEALIAKSMTPIEKYKEGLMEVIRLREYFLRDTALMQSEQSILTNLAQKYQDEALDALKPDRAHRQRDSFMELSPLMSVSGLQIGENIEQRQAADIAAIRARLESMAKGMLN